MKQLKYLVSDWFSTPQKILNTLVALRKDLAKLNTHLETLQSKEMKQVNELMGKLMKIACTCTNGIIDKNCKVHKDKPTPYDYKKRTNK